jgi:hypothetical protein
VRIVQLCSNSYRCGTACVLRAGACTKIHSLYQDTLQCTQDTETHDSNEPSKGYGWTPLPYLGIIQEARRQQGAHCTVDEACRQHLSFCAHTLTPVSTHWQPANCRQALAVLDLAVPGRQACGQLGAVSAGIHVHGQGRCSPADLFLSEVAFM